jgi:hypothetical protein
VKYVLFSLKAVVITQEIVTQAEREVAVLQPHGSIASNQGLYHAGGTRQGLGGGPGGRIS